MRILPTLIAMMCAGCALDAQLPEGRIRCALRADCPADWLCRKTQPADDTGLCFREAGSGGGLLIDSGTSEAGINPSDAASNPTDGAMNTADANIDGSNPVDASGGGMDGATRDAGSDASMNAAPSIISIVLGKRRTQQGASVSATCLASDPDNDALSFMWTASAGSFVDATAKNGSYNASAIGEAQLSCSIADGKGGTAQKTEPLRVYPTGLLSLLPFSLDASDQSGNGNGAILDNGVYGSDRAGNPSAAIQLDGASAKITLANESAFDLSGFSFVATLKPEAANHARVIVSKSATGFGAFTVLLYADDDASVPGRLQFAQQSVAGGPYAAILGTYKPTIGQYVQLVVTRSTSGELRAYADGVLIHTSTGLPAAELNDASVTLGNGSLGAFPGVIDEVQFYDRVLPAEEVQALVGMQ